LLTPARLSRKVLFHRDDDVQILAEQEIGNFNQMRLSALLLDYVRFPHSQYFPARFQQPLLLLIVSLDVPSNLFNPVIFRVVSAKLQFVQRSSMPEVAIDKYGKFFARESEVRTAWRAFVVLLEVYMLAPKEFEDDKLGLRILTSNPTHYLASFFYTKYITHNIIINDQARVSASSLLHTANHWPILLHAV
jgi:hypothetical protein